MKKTLVAMIALGSAVLGFAQPLAHMGPGAIGGMGMMGARNPGGLALGGYAQTELAKIETELGPKAIGAVTFAELVAYQDRLAGAAAKDLYLASTTGFSFMLPGAGQFRLGRGLEGTGFLTAHLGLVAGSLAGAYYFLPSDLRFDELNPFTSSTRELSSAWRGHSISDFLPSLGAMAAGGVADFGLRLWSAHSARAEAKAALDSGAIVPEPLLGPGLMGFRLRY